MTASAKEWRKENLDKVKLCRWQNGLKYYGLTVKQYDSMLQQQNGCCAICGRYWSAFKKRLHIDHDHMTNKVRGLLCTNCNTAIGLLNDNINLIMKSGIYLEKH